MSSRWCVRGIAIALGVGVAAGAVLAIDGTDARGAPTASSAKASGALDAGGPVTLLTSTPRAQRVLFEVAKGAAAVTHDLTFAKGALSVAGSSGDASLFVAFTAQTRPLAIEAKRYLLDDAGKIVESSVSPASVIDVVARPPNAALLLGDSKFAGHVIKVPRGDAPFLLRIRSAIPLEVAPHASDVELMARLGVRDGAAIPVDRIEVAGILGVDIRGARATLCGATAIDAPLVVEFPGYPPTPIDAGAAPPGGAKRSSADDLCVRVLF